MAQDYGSHYEQFERADAGKRERVLAAALAEFAERDYAQASTNAIVKRAGISKGLLFHYFGDKSGLFLYLLDDVLASYTAEVMELVNLDTSKPNDVFDLMKQAVTTKMAITSHRLLESRFIIRAMKSSLPPELRERIDAWMGKSFDTMATVTNTLDEQLLKEGVSKEQAAKVIYWVCEGMTNAMLEEMTPDLPLSGYQKITDEANACFDFLRQLMYKDASQAKLSQ